MNLPVLASRLRALFSLVRTFTCVALLVGVPLVVGQPIFAQTVQPLPTAAPLPIPVVTPSPIPTATPLPSPTAAPTATPTADPTPLPTATPVGAGGPSLIITPGMPSTAETEAYNATRTPQVTVTLNPTLPTTTPLPLAKQSGTCPTVTLLPAGSAPGKSMSSSTASTNPQPVALVTLAYASSSPGQLVWVQMARPAGTLSATDATGKVYPGDHGFFLTLGTAGLVTFTYQAPNVGGTYQIYTRYDNVLTALPFLVPDAAP